MAITYTAGTSVESTASVTSTTVTLPAGLANGDYTIIVVSLNATSGVITTPTGWTNILASTNSVNGSTSDALAIFYRKWVSGDTNPAITTTSGRVAATPFKVSGADGTTFVADAAVVNQNASLATPITTSAMTPTSPNVIAVWNGRHASNGIFLTPFSAVAGTEIAEANGKATAATNAGHCISAIAGTVGTSTGVLSATPANAPTGSMGVTFSLNAAAAGGGSFTPADNVGITDGVTLDRVVSRSDNVGITDGVALDRGVAQSDNVGITDGVALDRGVSASDSVGITDGTALDRGVSQADNVGITDGVSLDRGVALADNVGITDGTALGRGVSLADNFGITDGISLDRGISQSDPVNVTDGVTLDRSVVLPDSVGITDGVTLERSVVQADNVGITDSVTALFGTVLGPDPVNLTDSASAVFAFVKTPADNIGISDGVALDRGTPAADSVGITDSVAAVFGRVFNVSDTVGITDFGQTSGLVRDLTLKFAALASRFQPRLLAARFTTALLSRFSLALVQRFGTAALASRFANVPLGGIVTTTIHVSKGEIQYAGGVITETTGKDISAATYLVSLGSADVPGTGAVPDRNIAGASNNIRTVAKLINNTVPLGRYWVWIHVGDSPENVLIPVQEIIVA